MKPQLLAAVASTLLSVAAARAQPPAQTRPPQTGSAAPADQHPEQGAPTAGSYVIGPQDTLQITVVDEPDFSGKFRVDADGTISYPYLNQIRVTGMTVDDLRKRIVAGLQPDYIKNPQ